MPSSIYSSHSRLQKLEEKKNRKQAIVFTIFTILFILILLFVGFPAFVRLVGALGDVRSSQTKPDKADSIPPVVPTLTGEFEATSSSKTKVKGYGEPGSKIFLKINDVSDGENVVSEDGSYQFDITLEPGENQIIVYAKDLADNRSDDSRVLKIVYDSEAPKLEITAPKDGEKFYDEKEIVVGGVTEVDASVRINDFISTVDTEGNYARRVQLTNGENEITVVAIDKAGNKTEQKVKVSYNP